MVAPDTKIQSFFRYPEVWKDIVFILLIQRREHQHESRDVRGGGKIQPAVADASFQIILRNREGAGVPLVHRHPAHGGVRPLAEVELPELHFLRRVLFGALAGGAVVFHVHGLAQRWVDRLPDPGVCPVGLRRRGIDHGVERRVALAPFEDVQRLLMHFPADGVSVGSGGGQEKPQRLLARVAAALRHDVIQRTGGLGMQLVKDAGGHIQAMLGSYLAGEHLIDAAGGLVDHALHGRDDLDALHERRGLPDHVHRHVEHDGRLLPVGCTGIDLCLPFAVVDQHIERNGRAQL